MQVLESVGERTDPRSRTHPGTNREEVRNDAITPKRTPCTKILAGYENVELSGYSVEGKDSPEYVSVHRFERLAEIHISFQQLSAEVTQTLSEDTGYQDAVYGRLLECENILPMA